LFQQIATLSSENVELKNDGSFIYEDAIMTIEYDFWAESGKFHFIVTNNTDDNLYLNLRESYFVNNGYAFDYYQARTYVYANSNKSASNFIKSNSEIRDKYVNTSANVELSSYALASERGFSVEYVEQPIVCIPAHSSKAFYEFYVSSSVFRECGFVRDPSKREKAVREYTGSTSPRVIENRLVFKIGDIALPIDNVFYVSEYRNIAYDDVTEYKKVENCNGTKREVKVHKMSANNKFYITYDNDEDQSPDGFVTDRKSASFVKAGKRNYYDGIYR